MMIFDYFASTGDDHGLHLLVRVTIVVSPLLELVMIVGSHVLVSVIIIDSACLFAVDL
jgi:hypothetical protein